MTVGTFEAPVLQRFAASEIESEPLPQPAEFDALDDGAPAASPPAARTRLAAFLRESVTQYSVAMNVPADDRTSHLSADLAFGTIAARTVVRETQMRAEDPFLLSEERLSVRLFLRSLAQRDFFLQLGWFHADYGDAPLQEKMHGFSFARTHAGLEAWCAGATGFPLVDAGIRQLRATGWMHPHVRAVCASFLCFDLGVDWRVGRDEWDRHQIEDDPAIGTGNWQWIAGVGADMAQYPRIYNPERQRRRYDPNGTYVKRWVPELARLPVSAWHERLAATQITLPLFGDQTYARPIVNHETAAREFLKRYRAFVRSLTVLRRLGSALRLRLRRAQPFDCGYAALRMTGMGTRVILSLSKGLSLSKDGPAWYLGGDFFVDPVADDWDADLFAQPRLDAEVDAGDQEHRDEQRDQDLRRHAQPRDVGQQGEQTPEAGEPDVESECLQRLAPQEVRLLAIEQREQRKRPEWIAERDQRARFYRIGRCDDRCMRLRLGLSARRCGPGPGWNGSADLLLSGRSRVDFRGEAAARTCPAVVAARRANCLAAIGAGGDGRNVSVKIAIHFFGLQSQVLKTGVQVSRRPGRKASPR